ncbi:MAG TPA: hypothetical protein VFY42_10140 [Gemmatimonadales bacterium]|nr:hypothetical protein [Gemmatimonadales bacterium]
MKKTYNTPTLFVSGEAVRETLNSTNTSQPESVNPLVYKPRIGGSVGFGL